MEQHHERCDFYLLECLQCQEKQCRFEMQDHIKKECPNTIIQCVNGCEVKFERVKQSQHDSICLEKWLCCAYQSHGCCVMFKRKDENEHYDANLQTHLSLMSSKMKTFERQMRIMTNARTIQRHEIKRLQQNYATLKKAMQAKTTCYKSFHV